MNPFSAFVVYLIIWWLILFTVLPTGVRGQAEEDDIVEGSEPGAPVNSNMKRKLMLTTIIATIVWLIVCGIIVSGVVTWDDLERLLGINQGKGSVT